MSKQRGPAAVSVIIPCYGQAEYLADAVESVVAQTFRDWEIVIVDDGSPDTTAAVADALIARHPDRRIRLLRQANQGVAAARNAGIAASGGRYILPLDADDVLMPTMLEKTVGLLEAEPGVAIAYTDFEHFGVGSRHIDAGVLSLDALSRTNQIAVTSLHRREVWTAVGGYNPNMRGGYEDWDFWIGVAERGFVGRRIPELLFGYRTKASSRDVSATAIDAQLRRQIARNHPTVFNWRRRFRGFVHRNWELFPGRARYWGGWLVRRLTGRPSRRARE